MIIERELRDLLATHLAGAAIAGAGTITVATDGAVIPNKCILTITNGRTTPDLMNAEVIGISANTSGTLTIDESLYLGVHKKITDLDWAGLQGSWGDGTEVLMFFNQMYYETMVDAHNALFTDDEIFHGHHEFDHGLKVTGEPTDAQAADGSFRLKAGKLQAREGGVWKDVLTRGLPASAYTYGTLFYSPLSSWSATDQLRTLHKASAAGPLLDPLGEVSIKRQLTLWETSVNALTLTMTNGGLVVGDKHVTFEGDIDGSRDLTVAGVITTPEVITPLITSSSNLDLTIPTATTGDIRFFHDRDGGATQKYLTMYSGMNGIGFQFDPITGLIKMAGTLFHSTVADPAATNTLMRSFFVTRDNPIGGDGLKVLTVTTSDTSKCYIAETIGDTVGDIEISAGELMTLGVTRVDRFIDSYVIGDQFDPDYNGIGNDYLIMDHDEDTPIRFQQAVKVNSFLLVTNNIRVGDVLGDPGFGDIRYTSANAFEGYYEVSEGVGAWKSFRTEEANLPASTHGYMLRYEDGHWKGTGIIQAHDRGDGFIILDNDVIAYGAIRVGNIGDGVDPMRGMIRYNGDFQGRMNFKNSSGEYQDYWVSLTGGGITSGGQQGEMLVYNAEIERWTSAGGDILWVDHQLTIQGRLVPKQGLTVPPAGRLPEDHMPDSDLANQEWLQDNPVPWEAEDTPQIPGPAPDGNWMRVLPATGSRKIDKVQVWGQIGSSTHTSDDDTPTTQEVPTYGWLELVATTDDGGAFALPNPSGHNGQMIIVAGSNYTFTTAFGVATDLVTVTRSLKATGDFESTGFAKVVQLYSDGLIAVDAESGDPDDDTDEPQNFFGIGKYYTDRKGKDNQHNEDWMWQLIRKTPTTDSREYFPGDQDINDEQIPEEGYGKDAWGETDLVLQYHATARQDSLRTLLDSFTELDVLINGVTYSADGEANSYLPNFKITLTSGLTGSLAANVSISSFAGVFAKSVGTYIAGAVDITATIITPTTIAAFTSKPILIGGQAYTATTTGGNPATLNLSPALVSPILENTSVSNEVCIFGRVNTNFSIGATSITIDPYLAPKVNEFGNETIAISTVNYLGSSFGSRFDDNVTVTLTPGITVPLHDGDMVAANGQPLGLVDGEYPYIVDAATTTINMKRYYKAVEPIRLNRGGSAWFGKNLTVEEILKSKGPIVVGAFDVGTMVPEPGMMRYNGDMECLLGDKWVSMTNRLALPQVPCPVLNYPSAALWTSNTSSVSGWGTTPKQYTFFSTTGLTVGTLVTFTNGVATLVTAITGPTVTLDEEVMPSVEIEGDLYLVQSHSGSTITLVDTVTFAAGTRVLFANGAESKLIQDTTADTVLTTNKAIAGLSDNVTIDGDTYEALRLNDNRLVMRIHPAMAVGTEITLSTGDKVIVTEDYASVSHDLFSPDLVKVRYTEQIGATIAYDLLQGWHFNTTVLVKDSNVYLSEGLTFGPVVSISPEPGTVQWNGDLRVWNGTAWASLTGYGTEHIAPSDPGNTLVMGETNWQANENIRFVEHGGPGTAGVTTLKNILELTEFDDDAMPQDEMRRGMVRHRGDLEYYTGSNWISLTDYYGLPGGHLPLPGRVDGEVVPYDLGATVRYVLPEEGAEFGRWEATNDLTILSTGIVTKLVTTTGIQFVNVEQYSAPDGHIIYDGIDFFGRNGGEWISFTDKLGIANGDQYATLYMHVYTDDEDREGSDGVTHRAYLPTDKFRIEVAYAPGDDPPGDASTGANIIAGAPVLMEVPAAGGDLLKFVKLSAYHLDSKVNFDISLLDAARGFIVEKAFAIDETGFVFNLSGLVTGDLSVSGDVDAATGSFTSLAATGTSVLHTVTVSDHMQLTGIQSTLGYPVLVVGTLLSSELNETHPALLVNGLATFSNTIKIGDQKSEAPEDGMIRFHSGDFQGWSEDHWISFSSSGGPGSLTGPYAGRSIMVWSVDDDAWAVDEESMPLLLHGTGTPEGAVTAVIGTLFQRTDGGSGTTLYTKVSGTGNTGWELVSGSATYTPTNVPFTSETTFNVTHGLGKYPLVQVIDNTGAMIIPLTIIHNTVNDFTVTFTSATTGNVIY